MYSASNIHYRTSPDLPASGFDSVRPDRQPAGNRKDLLGLSGIPATVRPDSPERTVRSLSDLGFTVRQPKHSHWVLTLARPLPELHFYSALEMEQFARFKAPDYAKYPPEEEQE